MHNTECSARFLSRSLCLALCCLSLLFVFDQPSAQASVDVQLARHPDISPDGKQVAFGWKGDIWVVKTSGGTARRLTSHPGYDSHPVWSPNGKHIAFSSKRSGGQDVYVMDASGGTPRRLTYHSSRDRALFWLPQSNSLVFHSPRWAGVLRSHYLYQVGAKGDAPKLFLKVHAAGAALSPNGRYLAFVRGSGRWWRKRWKGPYHPTLWLYDIKGKKFKRLTAAGYSADSPSWVSNKELVFRSERTGTFNIWKLNVLTGKAMPYTHYRKKGVRYVKASSKGKRLVFSRWNKLYQIEMETGLTRPISIQATGDTSVPNIVRKVMTRGVKEYAVSANQKSVAFVVHGDLFLKRFKDPNPWARRIASSPWREKNPAWSPNGRTLAFVSDRHQQRDSIYLVHAGHRKGKPLPMLHTLQPKITKLTAKDSGQPETRPTWSPDGKELAFLRGRGTLVVRTMPNGPERVVVDSWNIGTFRWSPDGRWFAYTRMDRESNSDVYLVRSHGKSKPFNVSRFPDSDANPVWSANGRVLAFLSRGVYNRNGIRYVFLRKADHEKNAVQLKRSCRRWGMQWKRRMIRRKKLARKRRRSRRIQSQRKRKAPPTSRPTRKAKAKTKSKLRKKRKLRVKIDLRGLPFRLRYIPGLPGTRGGSSLNISPTGCRFYVVSRGKGVGGLYKVGILGKKMRRSIKGRLSKVSLHSKRIYFLKRGALYHLGGKRRKAPPRPLRFRAEVKIRPKVARLQMFSEGWTWLAQWFYDPKFHGVNWNAMKTAYQSLLHDAHTREEFDDVVRMMLGELNASHLGIYPPRTRKRPVSGDLGIRFDFSHRGKGLKVKSVRPKGPATHKRSRLRRGDIILSVDGHKLSSKVNIHQFLLHTTHRPVVLRVQRKSGKIVTLAMRPVSPGRARVERYKAWVETNRRRLHKWSGGLLAYAHVRAMGIQYLDQFERDLFAHAHNKKGLILDLRNNGGGWTADLMLTMFFPKPHGYTQWRGSRTGYPVFRRPFYTWHKPVVLLINERSVSNAEIFAHAFRNLKRGMIIGMPTYGGVISTRNVRLLDGSFFRIPLRGWWTLPGRKNMENGPAQPHIKIPVSPEDELKHIDRQMLRATRVLLKQLTKQSKR